MKAEDVMLASYNEGMSFLMRSGIFEFLREHGQVKAVPAGSVNYSELHIAEANRSIGYIQALDELIRFKEKYLQGGLTEVPPLDYGGLKDLVEKKIITKEEADELKRQFSGKPSDSTANTSAR